MGAGRAARSMNRPSPSWLAPVGWLVILLFPVVVLAGVEVGVRVLGIEPSLDREFSVPAWLDRNILVKESRWIELLSDSPRDLRNYYRTYLWDRELFYRLRPGLDLPLTDITAPPEVRPRTRWILHTNSKGLNAREVTYEKPRGTFRIVALGDSSTFGWGVNTDEIYPHVLEETLRERHPGAGVEVVNLGVCGYSSFQGLILLEREALRYDPDVVTLSYGSNDFSMVPESFQEAHARNLGWAGTVRELLNRSRAYQVYAALLMSRIGSAGGPAGEQVLNVGPEKAQDLMEAMADAAASRGIDPLFVSNCVPGEMSRPIRAAAAARGVPLLDTEALLEASIDRIVAGALLPGEFARYQGLYGAGNLSDYPWLAVYLTDRCHPNVIGHRLIAEALVPMVEQTASFQAFISSGR